MNRIFANFFLQIFSFQNLEITNFINRFFAKLDQKFCSIFKVERKSRFSTIFEGE